MFCLYKLYKKKQAKKCEKKDSLACTETEDCKVIVWLPLTSFQNRSKWNFCMKDISTTLFTDIIICSSYSSKFMEIQWGCLKHKRLVEKLHKLRLANNTLSIHASINATSLLNVLNQEDLLSRIESVISFMHRYEFNGLVLDYTNSSEKNLMELFILLQILSEKFDHYWKSTGRKLKLFISLNENVQVSSILHCKNLNEYVDAILINTEQYSLSSNVQTVAHEALEVEDMREEVEQDQSMISIIDHWIKSGVMPRKIFITLSTLGHVFQLNGEVDHKRIVPGFAGPYTDIEGQLSYFEILEMIKKRHLRKQIRPRHEFCSALRHDYTCVVFDDEESFQEKCRWVVKQNLGGVCVWSVDSDDFKGKHSGVKYPLLQSIQRIFQNGDSIPEDSDEGIVFNIQKNFSPFRRKIKSISFQSITTSSDEDRIELVENPQWSPSEVNHKKESSTEVINNETLLLPKKQEKVEIIITVNGKKVTILDNGEQILEGEENIEQRIETNDSFTRNTFDHIEERRCLEANQKQIIEKNINYKHYFEACD